MVSPPIPCELTVIIASRLEYLATEAASAANTAMFHVAVTDFCEVSDAIAPFFNNNHPKPASLNHTFDLLWQHFLDAKAAFLTAMEAALTSVQHHHNAFDSLVVQLCRDGLPALAIAVIANNIDKILRVSREVLPR